MNPLFDRAPFEVQVDYPFLGQQRYLLFGLSAAIDMFISDRDNGFSPILTFRRQFDSERIRTEVQP